MRSTPLTLLLALTAFKNEEDADAGKVTQVTPDKATRFAFKKDDSGNYTQAEISNQIGPQNDGNLEIVDAIYFGATDVDVTEIDRALVVRLETTELDDNAIQAIGSALESYMDQNGCDQFATAAVHDIGEGQELYGRWTSMVFTRDYDGKWSAKSIGFTSVAKNSDGDYAVLKDGKMAKINGSGLISTLLDNNKLQALLDGGYQLQGNKKAHLVRPPIGKDFAVVANGQQVVYDSEFQVTGTEDNFTTMQAIDVDGSPKAGVVNTISGSGNTWDVRTNIPASKAGGLAQAYGAQAA
ncbi:hypothetical protein HY626_00680 [Candidatus Uhrbacteria bacterium]|nr:hypothetical protein [Candidatus Uhrbacteria bacterium]